MIPLALICILVTFGPIGILSEFLRISKQNFYYGTTRVFLSGTNIARTTWDCYGCDFGNGNYEKRSRKILEQETTRISQAGGNLIRLWLHGEGQYTPQFNNEGWVTGPDAGNTLISDLGKYLDFAASKNVFINLVLWNGAGLGGGQKILPKMYEMIMNENKTYSYIDNVLRPLVQSLKDKPALASWEVLNEPEGLILIDEHSNPCYNTDKLGNTGAGWTGDKIPMERVSKFIARQNAVIHQLDGKALVTVGSFSDRPQTDAFSDSFNYYKDDCMIPSGGSNDAKLDYFQMHTYAPQKKWAPHSPHKIRAEEFKLNRPLVIGEFSTACSEGESSEQLYDRAYNRGYNGAWAWQYMEEGGECGDNKDIVDRGLGRLKNNSQNGTIRVVINNRRGRRRFPRGPFQNFSQ